MFKVAARRMTVITVTNSNSWPSSVKIRSKWDGTLMVSLRFVPIVLYFNV